MMKLVEHIPAVDEVFYWRCLIPCALRGRNRERDPRLSPEQVGTLHAVMVAHLDRMPLRVETYRAAQIIVADWWGAAERKSPSRGDAARNERRQP